MPRHGGNGKAVLLLLELLLEGGRCLRPPLLPSPTEGSVLAPYQKEGHVGREWQYNEYIRGGPHHYGFSMPKMPALLLPPPKKCPEVPPGSLTPLIAEVVRT